MQPSQSTTIHYQTFLFTMWQESADEGSTTQNWRFSLTDPHTMQRVGFSTLEKLMQYLQQRMEKDKEEYMSQEQSQTSHESNWPTGR